MRGHRLELTAVTATEAQALQFRKEAMDVLCLWETTYLLSCDALPGRSSTNQNPRVILETSRVRPRDAGRSPRSTRPHSENRNSSLQAMRLIVSDCFPKLVSVAMETYEWIVCIEIPV